MTRSPWVAQRNGDVIRTKALQRIRKNIKLWWHDKKSLSVSHICQQPLLPIYFTWQFCCGGWRTLCIWTGDKQWAPLMQSAAAHLLPLAGFHGEADVNKMEISSVQQPAVVTCCIEQKKEQKQKVKRVLTSEKKQSSQVFYFFCQQW